MKKTIKKRTRRTRPFEHDEYNTPFTWLDYILYGIAILVVAGVLAVFVTEVIFGEMITRWMYSV